MPGETITVDTANYPDLGNLDEGDKVKIVGRVTGTDENGQLTIETESVEQAERNPAKEELKSLMPGMRNRPKPSAPDEEEDY
mgnify:CR=1 FL=1